MIIYPGNHRVTVLDPSEGGGNGASDSDCGAVLRADDDIPRHVGVIAENNRIWTIHVGGADSGEIKEHRQAWCVAGIRTAAALRPRDSPRQLAGPQLVDELVASALEFVRSHRFPLSRCRGRTIFYQCSPEIAGAVITGACGVIQALIEHRET